MAVSGHDTVVAIVPTTTWDTAATLAATDGILPLSIDKIDKGGTWDFDDSSGLAFKTQGSIIAEEANPTIVGRMRWNGAWWCLPTNLFGDDTNTGAGPVITHTMTYQAESPLVGITLGIEINNTANGIMEVSSLKVQGVTFEPDGGFWNFNVTTLGTSVDKAGDATFDGAAADNVTYSSSAQRMRYKANQLRINGDAGALDSSDVIADARNMSIAFTRDYDPMDDVLKGAATGAELVRAEPVDNNNGIDGTFQFDQVTADITNFTNLFGEDFKADVIMAETIGSDAHVFTLQMLDIVLVEPQLALERGQRIPMTHNYTMGTPSASVTGMTSTNPFHFVLDNVTDVTYNTNA